MNKFLIQILEDRKKRKFNLERVGQYLQNQNLQKLFSTNFTSDWSKLLDQNECLKNSNFIYPHHKELSLVQVLNKILLFSKLSQKIIHKNIHTKILLGTQQFEREHPQAF